MYVCLTCSLSLCKTCIYIHTHIYIYTHTYIHTHIWPSSKHTTVTNLIIAYSYMSQTGTYIHTYKAVPVRNLSIRTQPGVGLINEGASMHTHTHIRIKHTYTHAKPT
jgi:hypothetical protein